MVNLCRIEPFDRTVPNALTVEVEERRNATLMCREETAQTAPVVSRLLELLAANRTHATFYIPGAVAEQQPAVVGMIHAAGHELGCLGHAHRSIGTLTPREFRSDIRQSREILRDLTGTAVDTYRAPDFSVTPGCRWALDVLIEEGFVFDSSIDPVRHDRSGVLANPTEPYLIQRPNGSLWELPPPVWTCLSMNRLDLYPLLRCGLYASNAVGRPFVANLRTRELGGKRGPRVEERLRQLLSDFAFTQASEVIARWCERVDPCVRRSAA